MHALELNINLEHMELGPAKERRDAHCS